MKFRSLQLVQRNSGPRLSWPSGLELAHLKSFRTKTKEFSVAHQFALPSALLCILYKMCSFVTIWNFSSLIEHVSDAYIFRLKTIKFVIMFFSLCYWDTAIRVTKYHFMNTHRTGYISPIFYEYVRAIFFPSSHPLNSTLPHAVI
jgi:hypothetical protein